MSGWSLVAWVGFYSGLVLLGLFDLYLLLYSLGWLFIVVILNYCVCC